MSVFTDLADRIKVRDLMGSVMALHLPMTVEEAVRVLDAQGGDAHWRPALVVEGDTTVGSVDYWSLRETETNARPLRELVRPVSLDATVSADSSAISAIGRFVELGEQPIFVLENTSIAGTLDFIDLFKPPMKMAVFGLLLGLEEALLRLCQRNAIQSWNVIGRPRQEQAYKFYASSHWSTFTFDRNMGRPQLRRAFGRPLPEGTLSAQENEKVERLIRELLEADSRAPATLLEYTSLGDKIDVLLQRHLLNDRESERLEHVKAPCERMRNWCAHPSGCVDIPGWLEQPRPTVFDALLRDCHALIRAASEGSDAG